MVNNQMLQEVIGDLDNFSEIVWKEARLQEVQEILPWYLDSNYEVRVRYYSQVQVSPLSKSLHFATSLL